jgi:hypothetical protein
MTPLYFWLLLNDHAVIAILDASFFERKIMTIFLVWWSHLTESEKEREVHSIDFSHTSSKKTLQQVWLGDTLLYKWHSHYNKCIPTSLAASTLIILVLEKN